MSLLVKLKVPSGLILSPESDTIGYAKDGTLTATVLIGLLHAKIPLISPFFGRLNKMLPFYLLAHFLCDEKIRQSAAQAVCFSKKVQILIRIPNRIWIYSQLFKSSMPFNPDPGPT
jgi:hypothetical protein